MLLKKRSFILLLCVFGCRPVFLKAQPLSRYNTFSYTVNDGLLQSTITDIAFDKNNFCWISYPNGIQKFDGRNFTTVPLQDGLPDDKHCRFFRLASGDLLISHVQGISRYNVQANRFSLVYRFTQTFTKPAYFIGECGGNIFIYTANGFITGLDNTGFKKVSDHAAGWGGFENNIANTPQIGNVLIENTAVFIIKNTIYTWHLSAGKQLSASAPLPGLSPYFLYPKSRNEILYYSYKPKGTIQVYQTAAGKSRALPVKGFESILLSRCQVFRWKDKWLLSVNDRLFETDSSLGVLHKEIVNFQNQPAAGGFIIAGIKEDNYGNLILQTVTGGIKKIIRNNYPVKYFNSGEEGKDFISAVFPDKQNNRVLAGAVQNGLLVYDTLQRLVKHVKVTGDNGRIISPNIILKKPNGHYLLFASGENKIWELNHELDISGTVSIQVARASDKPGAGFFGNFLWQQNNDAIVQTENMLYRLNLNANTIKGTGFSDAYIMGGIYQDGRIISHGNDELIIADAASFSVLQKIRLKNTGNVRCFVQDKERNILAGTNKGIFVTDASGKIKHQFSKNTGLPDECIYAMAVDENNNLWCSTNKGILKLKEGKVTEHLKKEDGLQENEFNTNIVAKSADGELFFGGVNGISSFYPAAISGYNETVDLYFTRIMANNENAAKDTAAWNLDKIELPYSDNALAFDFVAMGSFNPDQYLYQYRMKGVDKDWIANNGMQTVRYSLPPGKYVFQIFASRAYNEQAIPIKELQIIIHPPFWKTWWFIAAVISVFVLVLGYIINERNKRIFAKKLQQLENEKQLKEERERISKDLHDSLGAYANAVLYNTGLLESEKEEDRKKEILGDLKFASKDIITSLRETVWALKKESYTAEDCLVRIRNFIQPLARYYQHITFNIEGEAPPELVLHYVKALNLVRIMQEAVTNSIKHAAPSKITVTSSCCANTWILRQEDNGTGFNTAAVAEEKGNGLFNMKARAAASNFDLQIEPCINKGTQITVVYKYG